MKQTSHLAKLGHLFQLLFFLISFSLYADEGFDIPAMIKELKYEVTLEQIQEELDSFKELNRQEIASYIQSKGIKIVFLPRNNHEKLEELEQQFIGSFDNKEIDLDLNDSNTWPDEVLNTDAAAKYYFSKFEYLQSDAHGPNRTIEGIYLFPITNNKLSETNNSKVPFMKEGAIITWEDSSRATLIHEYLHSYLFNKKDRPSLNMNLSSGDISEQVKEIFGVYLEDEKLAEKMVIDLLKQETDKIEVNSKKLILDAFNNSAEEVFISALIHNFGEKLKVSLVERRSIALSYIPYSSEYYEQVSHQIVSVFEESITVLASLLGSLLPEAKKQEMNEHVVSSMARVKLSASQYKVFFNQANETAERLKEEK